MVFQLVSNRINISAWRIFSTSLWLNGSGNNWRNLQILEKENPLSIYITRRRYLLQSPKKKYLKPQKKK